MLFVRCNANVSKSVAKCALVGVLGMALWGCDSNNSKSNNQSTVNSSSSTASSSSQASLSKDNFALNFKMQSDGLDLDCNNMVTGFGPTGDNSIGLNDLRFYVSNVQFWDAEGVELEVTLDDSDFQLNHQAGTVALIDFAGNSEGYCSSNPEDRLLESSIATEATNTTITGQVDSGTIHAISFDVGVPQDLMKAVVNNHSMQDAPAPLNQMYWSWVGGYRHLLFNFAVMDSVTSGEGLVHMGSRGCTANPGELALEGKDECDWVNTAQVRLDNFMPSENSVVVDIDQLLKNVAFIKTTEGENGTEESPGVSCHSNPAQSDCSTLFENLGVDIETGQADASANSVFIKE